MPTYRWTFTCEEMYDDENETVNITTKTLVSDSETFTDVLILLPQLFNGAGFFIQPETFSYKDETFENWVYEKEETQARVLKRDFAPAGFRNEALVRPVDFDDDKAPYADPGLQVTGYVKGVGHLAGFPPTMSEE